MSEARKLAAKEPGRENARKRVRVRCSALAAADAANPAVSNG
jgi:hypothetical protein